MKFLPEDLKKAFKYDLKQCSNNKEFFQKTLICAEDVLRAHYILAYYFTDTTANADIEKMLVGVRSFDLLESAIHRKTCSFGGHQKYTNSLDISQPCFMA